MPYALISSNSEKTLLGPKFSLYCTFYSSFLPNNVDPKVCTKRRVDIEGNIGREVSATRNSADFNNDKVLRTHFLISAEPQRGKTQAFLTIVAMMTDLVFGVSQNDVTYTDEEEEADDGISSDEEVEPTKKPRVCEPIDTWRVPSEEAILALPNVPTTSGDGKYTRTFGR